MKKQPGFSLIELVVVLALNAILFGLALPVLERPLKDAAFDRFEFELTGTLIEARRYAQLSGRAVWFLPCENGGYRLVLDQRDGDLLTESGVAGTIQCRLPDQGLRHPTSGGALSSSFSSSHSDGFVFRAKGSSSGTIVYSDGHSRAVCMILSGQTGRFRVFSWNRWEDIWEPRY